MEISILDSLKIHSCKPKILLRHAESDSKTCANMRTKKKQKQKGDLHKEEPPKYAEAIYSVENRNALTDDNIHIRPSIVSDVPSYMPPLQQHQSPGQPSIVIQQPVFVRPLMFNHKCQAMICPNCSANIVSQTKYETGLANWLVAGGVCLLGYASPHHS